MRVSAQRERERQVGKTVPTARSVMSLMPGWGLPSTQRLLYYRTMPRACCIVQACTTGLR